MEPDQHPVNITIPHQESYSRWLALATLLFTIPKMIMLIPHFIVLYLLGIVAFIIAVLAQFAVLFTGKYPEGMHKIMVSILRWRIRVGAFFFGLTDKYPPFNFS